MSRQAPAAPAPPDRKTLVKATAAAIVAAMLVLVIAVLPAEYGIDPTGIGRGLGFAKLSESSDPVAVPNATTVYRYRLTWPVESSEFGAVDGYTAEGQTSEVRFSLGTPNATRVEALLSFSDDNETAGQPTRPDLFEVQVVGPDKTAGPGVLGRSGADGKGNATAARIWREPPTAQQVRAADDAEAAAAAAELVPTDASSVGEWTVRVTVHDAGDADAQGLPVSGPAGDQGNTWTLRVTVEAFRFDPSTLNASREREDVARIEIAAGAGLEYKFDLEAGATLEYAWNTTGAPLYFDFHGEPRGDTTGAFTSHKTGTADRDRGSLTAPFAGTHGWYWENRNDQSVTVELVTSGVYTVIGRK